MGNRSFLAALFDLSFSEFITTRLVKILYVLLIALVAIGYVVAVFGALLSGEIGQALLMLIVGAVVALIYIIMARVWMELIIVIFRIAENTSEMVKMKRYDQ
jgi:hypothetical protein